MKENANGVGWFSDLKGVPPREVRLHRAGRTKKPAREQEGQILREFEFPRVYSLWGPAWEIAGWSVSKFSEDIIASKVVDRLAVTSCSG